MATGVPPGVRGQPVGGVLCLRFRRYGSGGRVLQRGRFKSLAWLLALGLVAPVQAQPDAYGLTALAASLENADYGERADFARLALDELIASYREVLDIRAGSPPTLGGKGDLQRWRAATSGFVSQLRQARWQLERGAQVRMTTGPDGTVALFVGRQPVLLSGPDPKRTELLQRSVVSRFCTEHPCTQMQARTGSTSGTVAAAVVAAGRADDDAHWSFAQDRRPSYVTASGMRFVFDDISDRGEKERLSRQVSGELFRLADALRTAAWDGRRLEWDSLQLRPRAHGSLEQVMLNRRGDRLDLSLPTLAAAPGVWREALPWLRKQVDNQPSSLTLWQADGLLNTPQPTRGWVGAQR